LGEIGVIADLLVFYPIDQRQPLGSVDHLAGNLNEGLRISFEIFQAPALGENPDETLARELGSVLQIRQYIRQRDVAFLDGNDSSAILASLRGLNAALPDRKIGLSDPDTRLGHGGPLAMALPQSTSSFSLSK
jgi:hypothetical protein